MYCPVCYQSLESIRLGSVHLDRCPRCQGIWFDHDELRQAKDITVPQAVWLDVEMWTDETKIRARHSGKLCPKCDAFTFTLRYGQSRIEIDYCHNCSGVWLDSGEFEAIIQYMNHTWAHEVMHHYTRHVIHESLEILTGPEPLKSELADLRMLADLLKYKIMINNQKIGHSLIHLPPLALQLV